MASSLILQFRPSATTPTAVLEGPREVSFLSVCNTSTGSATFSLYVSVGRTNPAWDESTAIQWKVPVTQGETVIVELPERIILADSKTRLAFETDVANALTVNIFGVNL